MSYISFFQFLFGITTVDELIQVSLVPGIDKKYNNVILASIFIVLWIICNVIIYYAETTRKYKNMLIFCEKQHILFIQI